MKKLILAVLVAATVVLGGVANARDLLYGEQVNSTFPEGSISNPE